MVTLEQAVKEVRRTLEASYQGLCTIVEYHDVTDPKTKLSKEKEVVITENQPCKLSFRKLAAAVQTETAAAVSQSVTLFLAPEIPVKSNSKIIVVQNDRTEEYSASGKPAVYSTHQEIPLELFRGWS